MTIGRSDVKTRIKAIFRQIVYRYPRARAVLAPVLVPRQAFLRKWISRAPIDRSLTILFAEPPLCSVSAFNGVFYIDPRSDVFSRVLMHGTYEPILAALVRRLVDPTRDVLDVGANIGFYTVLGAKCTTARVLAIEPTENALMLLRRNVKRNAVSARVVIVEGVVSDRMGRRTITFVDGKEEYSSIGGLNHPSVIGKPHSHKTVNSTTLDQLVAQHCLNPGFVKIDVEGTEQEVLAGASALLTSARPVILSEFSPYLLRRNGVDPNGLIHKLREQGYRLVDPLMPRIPLGRRKFGDLLGAPEERYTESEFSTLVADAHSEH